MAELNYERDVEIDPNALDVEWLQQPELMRRYTRHCAKMERLKNTAKEALDVGKAEIEKAVRSDPDKYGLPKATEAAIQSAILLQPRYQELSEAHINARYEYEIAKGAVNAMDQKKSALENLVKLLGQSYFAGPKAPRNLVKELEEKRRRNDAKVRFTRTRRSGTE